MLQLGIKDVFGESGAAKELIKKYELDSESIANKVQKFLNSKTFS